MDELTAQSFVGQNVNVTLATDNGACNYDKMTHTGKLTQVFNGYITLTTPLPPLGQVTTMLALNIIHTIAKQ